MAKLSETKISNIESKGSRLLHKYLNRVSVSPNSHSSFLMCCGKTKKTFGLITDYKLYEKRLIWEGLTYGNMESAKFLE